MIIKVVCLVLVILNFSAVLAECVLNKKGEVVCARYPAGGAAVSIEGPVKCGWGECVINKKGIVVCSKIEGGGALLNSEGEPRCLGGCEKGSRYRCKQGEP